MKDKQFGMSGGSCTEICGCASCTSNLGVNYRKLEIMKVLEVNGYEV